MYNAGDDNNCISLTIITVVNKIKCKMNKKRAEIVFKNVYFTIEFDL